MQIASPVLDGGSGTLFRADGAADGGAASASLGSIVGDGGSNREPANLAIELRAIEPRTRDASVARGELEGTLDVRRYFCVIRRGHVRAGTKTRSRLLERLRAAAARGARHRDR